MKVARKVGELPLRQGIKRDISRNIFTYVCTNKVKKKEGTRNVEYKHTADMLQKGLKGLKFDGDWKYASDLSETRFWRERDMIKENCIKF